MNEAKRLEEILRRARGQMDEQPISLDAEDYPFEVLKRYYEQMDKTIETADEVMKDLRALRFNMQYELARLALRLGKRDEDE